MRKGFDVHSIAIPIPTCAERVALMEKLSDTMDAFHELKQLQNELLKKCAQGVQIEEMELTLQQHTFEVRAAWGDYCQHCEDHNCSSEDTAEGAPNFIVSSFRLLIH